MTTSYIVSSVAY